MHNPREFSYVSCGEAFIGCPSDAERYEQLIQKIWWGLPVPGLRRNIMHWKKDYDAFASKGAEPDQYKIAKTSDPATNPVFILFAHKIGTSVRPPSGDTRDWDALREWLNRRGWRRIAMLGDADFQDEAQVPEGKIPLSGTLYELFDAMRTGDQTDLRIYDLSHIARSAPAAEPGAKQQAQWCQQLLNQLRKNFTVRAPRSESEFEENAEEDLRQAFEVPRFDPLTDPLPGLDAISSKTPLLFGRSKDIERLSAHVFGEQPAAFTSVVGVSGAGKSSLMRGGLMREWFRASPSGPGRREGATALLVEPQLLQLDDAADPLQTLARLLTTAPDQAPDRVVGPMPGPLASQPPPLAPPGGDLKKDLPAVIRWWAALTEALQDKERQGPLVLILDQAEQIEAAARRAAQAEAERTGQPVAPELSPQWRRFTGLFAALSGVLDPAYGTPELDDQIEKVNRRRPLRLLLTLHRKSALDLWPLKEALPEPVQVAPLTRQAEWQSVIEGTCRAYGLTLDKRLRKSMVDEAVHLAEMQVHVSEADDVQIPTTHARASVLPQVRTALQRIITRWRELHEGKNERKKLDKAAYTLDAETFAPRAGIAGAIEALGEEAWQDWQAALAESTGTNRASIFGQQELAEEQNRRFADLMSGLVDARNAGQQDLSKLLRGGERARRHKALVEALLTHRMLTRAGESEDRRYLLLSHRSVLDHWPRAAQWLKQATPRLKVKASLIDHYQRKHKAEDRWHQDDLDDFAHLAVNWIGSGEGEDGEALKYLKSGLCARLDPAQVGLRAETRLARLPFTALSAGDTDFFGHLLHKCMTSPAWPDIALGFVLAISDNGKAEFLKTVLEGDDKAILCNTVHRETGASPLLLAAQNGRDKVVALLLNKGAEPNQVDEKTGTFPLLQAAQNGHDKAVALLLDKSAEPNQVGKNGLFPLLQAAQNGYDKVVALLLDKGAEPDRVNEKNGTFPLLQAAQNGHDKAVALLLDQGAEPNRVNEKNGTFPLLQAAQNGHDKAVAMLLDQGAEPNRVNEKNGTFPLLMAAQNGHDKAVVLLLAKGAEPNRVNEKNGTFPLLQAAQEGHDKAVVLLLDKGAEPNQVGKNGLFPLLQAAQESHDKVVKLLLARGAEPNRVNKKNGAFPLFMAAQNGHDKAVALLLDQGAEPNRVNEKNGTFPLLEAAQNGHDKAVAMLLDKGAEPNRVNEKDGSFPLLQAAQEGHDKVVALLLDKGTEPNRVDKDGRFPLLMAAQNGHDKAVALLLAKGAEPDRVHKETGVFPMLQAAQEGHDQAVALLLAKGAEPNRVNEKNGAFPLLQAAQEGHDKAVALLLAKGAEPNRVNEKNGAFPLLMAAQNGHDKAVALLLDKGAEPNRVNEKNGTFPLLQAAKNGHDQAVALLLDKGAEPNRVNEKNGTFPLGLAAQEDHDKVVALLLDKGADPNQVNEQTGTFPLLQAAKNGHDQAVALLLDKGAEPNQVGKNGLFPLLMAAQEGHDKAVALLLAKGADIDQRHESSGITSLAAAIAAKKGSTAAILLDSGALIRNLPQPLITMIVHILFGRDWPQDRASKDAGQQKQTDQDTPTDLAAAIPAFPIPGRWVPAEVDERLQEGLREILGQLPIPPDSVKGHLLSRNLSLSGDDSLYLRQCCLAVDQAEHTFVVDCLWLDGGKRFEPFLVSPGTPPLDAIIEGLKDKSILPDFRLPETKMTWAALAVLLGDDVPRMPLMQDHELPLADGARKPRFRIPEEAWREWGNRSGPAGPYVELPWIEGRDLVWGKVSTPAGGVGLRVLAEREVLARDIDWAIPQFAVDEDGITLPFRYLGKIEQRQQ